VSDKDAETAVESQSPENSDRAPKVSEAGGEARSAVSASPPADAVDRAGKMSVKAAGEPPAQREEQSTLGADLTRAREQRGRSREDVASETHIPLNYVRMIESDDYSMIADQLYMLPFVRRYAAYLGMDEDEAAMRFVREVQRADNNPPPRLDHPLDGGVRRRSRRSSVFMVALAVLVIVIGLYFYFSPHHGSVGDAPASGPFHPAAAAANGGARNAPAGSSPASQSP